MFRRIVFAANDSVAAQMRAEGFVVYTADELERIIKKGFTREELRKLHEVKTIFPGSKVSQ